MASLYITDIVEMFDQGTTVLGKHGAATDIRSKPFSVTATGEVLKRVDNSLADATAVTLWSGSDPDTFINLWFWASAACVLQFFGDSMNFSIKVAATQPFKLGTDDIVIANNTTEHSSDPTTENIDKILLWNDSGDTLAYVAYIIL